MKFSELNLKQNNKVKTIKINNLEINVKQYLPMEDKINLVQIALQQSMQDGIYNDGLLTAYFHVYIAMFYTDIEFTDEEKQDVLTLFNILDSTETMGLIIGAIPEKELTDLTDLLNNQQSIMVTYKQSAAYLIGQFIDALPQQMEEVSKIINNFDPTKYQQVVDFATAANGGRNINTNQPVE